MNAERLASTSAIILGLNESGFTAASLLAQAGVGKIALMDTGAGTNHVQALAADASNQNYLEKARQHLLRINPQIKVTLIEERFSFQNAHLLLAKFNLVLDNLTNWQDKLLASDVCMNLGKPFFHAGVLGHAFQVFFAQPGTTACLRCLLLQIGMEDLARQEAQATFATIETMAGSLQAALAIKYICRQGMPSQGNLLGFDLLKGEFYNLGNFAPRADCPDCGRPNLDV